MRKVNENTMQSAQAALIVTYGNTTKRYRPLDRDLVVIGRAPVCDVSLVSPEVAPIHCLVQRTAEGWRVRDCSGGRHATRLNGRTIQEESLHDTDVLQVGTFTFEVRLPTPRVTPLFGSVPAVNDALATRLRRLQRSRRNLARLALKQRQRARRSATLPPTLAELERQAESLRNLQRDYAALVQEYEARKSELEKVEHEVCDERTAFEQECRERQARLDLAELDFARRQAEEGRSLDRRRRELDAFARHLRRQQQALPPISPSERLLQGGPLPQHEKTGERLSQLLRLKPILARSNAPSAPGDQLRSESEAILNPVESSVDCTAAVDP